MNTKMRAIGREVAIVACLSVFFALLLVISLRLWRVNLEIPFFYSFEDAADGYNIVRSICMGSGVAIPADYSLLYVLELKALYAITGSIGLTLNLSLLINLYFTMLVTYAVARKIRNGVFASCVVAISFSFSAYPFVQEFYYSGMSMIVFVPLAIWLAIWIMENDNCLDIKKLIVPVIFIVLISLTGGGYYLFFTGVIVLVTGLSVLLKKHNYKSLAASGILIVESLILHIILGIGQTNISGSVEQSEVLGLKLFQFFVPTNALKIGAINDYINEYNEKSTYINENMGSYLGIVGIIGFVILILIILVSINSTKINDRLIVFSEITVALIFVGEIGGLGTMLVLATGMRLVAFNRVSIFITCICIFAVANVVDWIYTQIKAKWKMVAFSVLLLGITSVSVLSQVPQLFYTYTEVSEEVYNGGVLPAQEVGGVR